MAPNRDNKKVGKKYNCVCVEVPDEGASTSAGPSNCTTPRSCRPGIMTKNPFLNYCRHIRETHCGLSAIDVVKKAAQDWRTFSPEKKKQFSSNCGGGRKTRNPFLNYVRELRGASCGKHQVTIVKEAAQQWNTMSGDEKMKYQVIAKKAPRRHGLKHHRQQ